MGLRGEPRPAAPPVAAPDPPLGAVGGGLGPARPPSRGDAESVADGTTGWFAGILTKAERIVTKKGKVMIDYTIEDLDGFMNGALFGNVYQRYESLFAEDAIVRLRAKVEASDRGTQLTTLAVHPLAAARPSRPAPGLLLSVARPAPPD